MISSKDISKNKRYIVLIVFIFIIFLATLEYTNTTHFFHKPAAAPTNTVPNMETGSNKLPAQALPSDQQATGTDSAITTTTDTPGDVKNINLAAPSGSFVSNHKPNLSGTPAPNQEESICISTPGAQCEIIFTKDGVVKKLAAKTTDANGTAHWVWILQEIGLTEGKWQIEAVARHDNQVKTTKDTILLEVKP